MIMDLLVSSDGTARFADRLCRCALGRGGVSEAKSEGDGATPIGIWPLRRLLYRPDRLAPPPTGLPTTQIGPADGWCDASGDKNYNLPVILPYPARTEALWRADAVYDLIVPLGYNDGPILPGRGSAIFLHLARRPRPGRSAGLSGARHAPVTRRRHALMGGRSPKIADPIRTWVAPCCTARR
jgi:L,D-peptidoglycan transpeptidase YkuD (ErfK/YbiS/YcfS/YnhG family)